MNLVYLTGYELFCGHPLIILKNTERIIKSRSFSLTRAETSSCVKHHNNFIGEQCQIGDLPVAISAPSGVIFDDVPLFCGGHKTGDPTTNCYKLRDDLTWDQVNWLS